MAAVREVCVDAGASACSIIAMAGVYSALFGPGEKVSGVFGGEGDACRCYLVSLAGCRSGEFEEFLWLG